MEKKGKKGKKEKITITGNEAVALAYDPAAVELPKVIAKGRGALAEELIHLAVMHNIPIKYDPDLVQVLSKLDIGDEIPEEVYLIVAEIMAFVYWVNHELFSRADSV